MDRERTMKMAGTDWSQYWTLIQKRKAYLLSQPHEDVYQTSFDDLKWRTEVIPDLGQKLNYEIVETIIFDKKKYNDFLNGFMWYFDGVSKFGLRYFYGLGDDGLAYYCDDGQIFPAGWIPEQPYDPAEDWGEDWMDNWD